MAAVENSKSWLNILHSYLLWSPLRTVIKSVVKRSSIYDAHIEGWDGRAIVDACRGLCGVYHHTANTLSILHRCYPTNYCCLQLQPTIVGLNGADFMPGCPFGRHNIPLFPEIWYNLKNHWIVIREARTVIVDGPGNRQWIESATSRNRRRILILLEGSEAYALLSRVRNKTAMHC